MSDEWQPIETAPIEPDKAFTALLYVPGLNDWQRPRELPLILVGAWNGYHWITDYAEMEGYESTGDYITHPAVFPTHWLPLPPPPTKKGGGE